jgi:hypothetical protein
VAEPCRRDHGSSSHDGFGRVVERTPVPDPPLSPWNREDDAAILSEGLAMTGEGSEVTLLMPDVDGEQHHQR